MSRRLMVLGGIVTALLVFSLAQAQEPGGAGAKHRGEGKARERGAQRQEGGRGNWDPAQMRERMLTNLKEQLAASDAEWTELKPKLDKALALQLDMHPRMSAAAGRMRSGDAAAGEEPNKLAQAQHDLRTALEKKDTPADELTTKVAALRDMRHKAHEELKATQKEIKGIVRADARQEAVLVVNGILE